MKKIIFILLFLLIIPFDCFAFRYVGVGAGPGFGLKGFDGTKYFINAEWQPSEHVGTRFFVGFPQGVWLGVGLNFSFSTTDSFSRSVKLTANGGIPFILNIRDSSKTAFFGFNAGGTLSFDTDGRGIYYIYVTPVELFFIPVTWQISPSGGFDLTSNIFMLTAVGFRASI